MRSENIGLDRDRLPSWQYQPSRYNSHTMKSSDPLLLAGGNSRCGMYPASKVAISPHLITPKFPRCDHTVGNLSADAGVHWNEKWIIADLLTSSQPHMSASHLLGLQVRANGPSFSLGLVSITKIICIHGGVPVCTYKIIKSRISDFFYNWKWNRHICVKEHILFTKQDVWVLKSKIFGQKSMCLKETGKTHPVHCTLWVKSWVWF